MVLMSGSVAARPVGESGIPALKNAAFSIIKSIAVGKLPEGPVYDAANGNIYVPNEDSSSVSVISSATNKVTATIPVTHTEPGSVLTGAVLDPWARELFVVDENNFGNVSIINTTNDKLTATVPLNIGFPIYPYYNPYNREVYVISQELGIAVIATPTNKETALPVCPGNRTHVAFVTPLGLYLDNATHDFVTDCPTTGAISIINSVTNAVTTLYLPKGNHPDFQVYDPTNKDMYIVDTGGEFNLFNRSANVTVLGPSNTIVATVATTGALGTNPTYDPSNHEIYVMGLTFNKTLGPDPSVLTVLSNTSKVVSKITVGFGAEIATYDPANTELYVPSLKTNTTDVINGTTNKVVSTLVSHGDPYVAVYDPSNHYIGILGYLSSTEISTLTVYSSANKLVTTLTHTGDFSSGFVYDPSNADFYASDPKLDTVVVFH